MFVLNTKELICLYLLDLKNEKVLTMSSQRFWLAGLIAGMLFMMSLPMMFDVIVIHPWSLLLMAGLVVSGLLISYTLVPWLTVVTVFVYVTSMAILGRTDTSFWALGLLIEISGMIIAGVLVYGVGYQFKQFENAFLQMVMIRRSSNLQTQQTVQEEMEREIRRARRFERPLSLVSIEPINSCSEKQLHHHLKELVSKFEKQLLRGQIANLFTSQTKANDIITYQDGKFLVLLPETDKRQAEAMAQRLNSLCEQTLELSVQTETASFPSEELTLSGLINRTVNSNSSEKEMPFASEAEEIIVEEFVLQESV